MVYPLTLRFLSTYQLSAEIENQISLNSYIDNFMMLVLCMGLAFELPLVTLLLSLLGLVNKSFLRKYRRHAIVLIVIAAAVITPTGDPFTLSIVAIPLYLLYEMSILMIKDKTARRSHTYSSLHISVSLDTASISSHNSFIPLSYKKKAYFLIHTNYTFHIFAVFNTHITSLMMKIKKR